MGQAWRIAGRSGCLALLLALAGCGGGADRSGDKDSGDGAQARSLEQHFAQNVQPSLGFCRSCHVPGGVADVEKGRGFQLGSDPSQDLASLRASWQRLGGNNPTSRLLLMASGQETPHTGGAPWPKDGAAYRNAEILFQCFADPSGCAARLGGGSTVALAPLLETDPSAAWSHNEAFCEGQQQPDSALIPEDPRHLVLPGINVGRAVAFNAFWEDCHQNIPVKRAQTCGEYRDRKRRGREQAIQSPSDGLFGEANLLFQISRSGFDNLWRTWGLPGRPADFEERLVQRYGLAPADFRNPYPRPGEDPNATDGGSGQLPLGLVQMKDAEGRWTGKVTQTCATCHSARLGEPADGEGLGGIVGMGPQNLDLHLLTVDFLASNTQLPSSAIPLPLDLSARRGAINAAGFSVIALAIVDLDILRGSSPVPRFNLAVPSTGNTKTVSWWHTLHRMRSFFDGVHGIDNHRMNSVAFGGVNQTTATFAGVPFDLLGNEEKYVETVSEFMNSMRPPKYPRAVDTALAEQGAVLFHAKDLWAGGRLEGIPKPESNGSCAGCHGVYSPRYAQDPAYLADPRLKGITGYLAPLETIGVDPARAANFPAEVRYGLTSSWIGYPEGVPGWVDPKDKNPLQEMIDDYPPMGMSSRPQGICTWHQEVGYNTPSLYGVWANGPYLHNGSVPTVWQLLKPEERPALWRRQLVAGTAEERGYDTSLSAYDFEAMGWKHEVLSCAGTDLSCNAEAAPLLNMPANLPTGGLGGSGLLELRPAERETIERRKIHNTHQFAAGNQGHDYGRALTDAERRALIEYLKTL